MLTALSVSVQAHVWPRSFDIQSKGCAADFGICSGAKEFVSELDIPCEVAVPVDALGISHLQFSLHLFPKII